MVSKNLLEQVFAELNLCRSNPAKYSEKIETSLQYYNGNTLEKPGNIPIDTEEGPENVKDCANQLKATGPLPILSWSKALASAAQAHIDDIGPSGAMGHTGIDGSDAGDRIERFGNWLESIGEVIEYGSTVPEDIVINLLIDDGVTSRRHRNTILKPEFAFVGLGYGPHADWEFATVGVFAQGVVEKNVQAPEIIDPLIKIEDFSISNQPFVTKEDTINNQDDPDIEEEESTIQRHQTVLKQENNIVKKEDPGIHREDHAIKKEEIIINREEPIINRESPIINRESPIINRESPIVNRESPIVNPIINRESPIVNREEPIVNREEPIVKGEEPIVNREEPIVKGEEPIVNREEPIVNREEPIVNREEPIVNREEPIVKREEPIIRRQSSIIKREQPVIKVDDSIFKKENSIVKKENSIVKKENTIIKKEEPVSKKVEPKIPISILKKEEPKPSAVVLKLEEPKPILKKDPKPKTEQAKPATKAGTSQLIKEIPGKPAPKPSGSKAFNPKDYERPGLSEEDIEDIKEAFDLFDTDKSGTVEPRELKCAMESLGFEAKNATLFYVVSELDKDGSGSIDFDEFVDMMASKISESETRDEIQQIFKLFDVDKTGYINIKNLKKISKDLGETVSDDDLLELIRKGDSDGDGRVSFDDFYNIMTTKFSN
jgi:centrin-1